MKKTILALTALVILASCKKPTETISTNPEEISLSPDIDLEITGSSLATQPAYQPSANYSYLGYGYDVADVFNHVSSVRAPVVDIVSFVKNREYAVNKNNGTSGSWTTFNATSALNLAEKFSNATPATNGLQVYGNTLRNVFPQANVFDKKYIYGYYSQYFIRRTFTFYPEEDVNNFLSETFKSDLLVLDDAALVKKYGTHVMAGVMIGSTLDVFYQAETNKGNREAVALEGLRYAMKRTFGLPTGYLDDVVLTDLHGNSKAKIFYQSRGGDRTKLVEELIKERRFVNLTNWMASRNEETYTFIAPSEDRLTPLHAYVTDPVRKERLKNFILQYLKEKAVTLSN
ncbi:membrane lipoprotein lipid attachment site-containing protein [Pedobacter rhizosphaerae]|uniref:MAC/Perforin domain-containing protein n=1 Tax=Pedobacter rhizosphaerae TaxID=390241 RepID=A0A1H9K847_9SPHI|nr:membrane lipoprotein lipid attachment site-containing protein [Pedobacter rhizosphaerae]SEQ95093.1 hypothetical protein SAMN04488023_102252 [Pedobacter rhizosphaerae]